MGLVNKLATATIGIGALVGSANAQESAKVAYTMPDTVTATQIGKEQIKDLIPEISGAETILRVYKTSEGTYFNTLSVKNSKGEERIYGYFIDIDGKPPFEEVYMDSDGNGQMDLKDDYNQGNKSGTIGDWLQKFYQS